MRRTFGPEPRYPYVQALAPKLRSKPIIIAGPCSIEGPKQIASIANELAKHDIDYMRGGVYRAGTYPPKDFGLKRELLKEYAMMAHFRKLRIIVEILDVREIDFVSQYADAYQVGARHMQDYALLSELSEAGKPVTLKRNMGATLDEFLGAAEYLASKYCQLILIERGSSTFHNHVRWDLSMSLIAAVKLITSIPIIVDGSHGTGRMDLVKPMIMSGLAAGADGYLIEVHPEPKRSLSDSEQAFPLGEFGDLKENADLVYQIVNKKIVGMGAA